MKKIMAIAGFAALIAAGYASDDDYRGGTWEDTDRGTTGSSVDQPTGVLQDPNTVGGRSHRPAEDSVGGTAQGPDAVDRGFGSGISTNAPDLDTDLDNQLDDTDLPDMPDMPEETP